MKEPVVLEVFVVAGMGREGGAFHGASVQGMAGRILRFPLLWAIVGMLVIFVVAMVPYQAIDNVFLSTLVGVVVGIALYLAIMWFWARRATPELAIRALVPGTLGGLGFGVAYLAISVLLLMAVGAYTLTVAPGAGWTVLGTAILGSLAAPVIEELVFRGLLLQAVERLLGSIPALVLVAVIFGASHGANPGASPWSALSIVLGGGLLLTAAFLWRRSLWFTIGIHWAWNTLTALLITPGGGDPADGLVRVQPSGPDLLTGGSYGIEASLVVAVIGVAAAGVMLWLAHKRGTLTGPAWASKQSRRDEETS